MAHTERALAQLIEPGEDARVTVTVQSKVTGKTVELHFPNAKFIEGMVESHVEFEDFHEIGEFYPKVFGPIVRHLTFELKLNAYNDLEAENMLTLTRTD